MSPKNYGLGKPYQMAANPPPRMSWTKYAAVLRREWPDLLNSDRQRTEAPYQDFLESHPCLLPESSGDWPPLHCALFSQPELPGFKRKSPDFMWLEQDSARITAVMIEIKAPAKRWCTAKGKRHHDLTAAQDQLADWRAWFQERSNVSQFCRLYYIADEALRSRKLEQRYILIYGRRDDATKLESFAKKRADWEHPDELLMSYDRLAPKEKLAHYPTIKLDRSCPDVRFRMHRVPPTFALGPCSASAWARLAGREEAIRQNRRLSGKRKKFLIKRLKYWDDWSRHHQTGVIPAAAGAVFTRDGVVYPGDRE